MASRIAGSQGTFLAVIELIGLIERVLRGETDAIDQLSVNIKGAAQNSRDPWALVGVLVEAIVQTLVWWLSVSERCTARLA